MRILLSSFLSDEGLTSQIELTDGTLTEPPIDTETAQSIRAIITKNGYTVRFGSEPDVAVRTPEGRLVGTIEVKYGSDPAGALERYGAAKKSFEEAVRENARVQNVYLANAITGEVRRRINADRLVSDIFEFGRLATEGSERQRLVAFIKHRMLEM